MWLTVAIAVVALALLALAAFALRARRLMAVTPRIPGVEIDTPVDDTHVDGHGACSSVQSATLTLPAGVLADLWTPVQLERLGRTYWAFLSYFTLHVVRIFYTQDRRSLAILARPFTMLGFDAPRYETADGWGRVRWPISHGLLVAGRGKREQAGYLEIEVERREQLPDGRLRVHVEVEVANFFPLAQRISPWLYANTQSRIHVLLAYGFLRRITERELDESVTGRFAGQD